MTRKPYPSNLKDAEWAVLEPLLPPHKPIGSRREVELREVVNALMYVADNGIKWRALPHDFPAWETVYGYFRRWTHSGVWEAVNQALSQQVRVEAGRHEQPSLGLIDSQSVKMAQKGDLNTGVDGNKKVKGRKRHLMVDVLGLVMSCFVSAANVADVKAAPAVLVPALENNPDLRKILADQSYRGAIAVWLQTAYDCKLELTEKRGQGFVVAPWRWVVERTFAWLDNARRLRRDYEELPEHHEGFIYVTMIRLMLRQLTQNQRTR